MADQYRRDFIPSHNESLHRSRTSTERSPPHIEVRNSQYLSPDDHGTYGRQRSSSSSNVYGDAAPKSFLRGNPARRSADFEQYRQQSKELYMLRTRYQDCTNITSKILSICRLRVQKDQELRADLTFSKILKRVDAIDFRLREWAMEAGIDTAHDIEEELRITSMKVSDNLNRLASTLKTLCSLCSKSISSDLARQEDIESLDSEDDFSDNGAGKYMTIRVPVGIEIKQQLTSIDTQMQTLSLLSEPLQYSTTTSVVREAVSNIVAESEKYFGSKEALQRYSVDEKLFGSEAIRAAQESDVKIEMDNKMKKMNFADSSMKPYLRRGRQTERQEKFTGDPFAHVPVYIKVKREFVSSETLEYYELPWEVDQNNPEYITILREMDETETDIIFEHTRRLRLRENMVGKPLPEERQQYVYVRKGRKPEEPRRSEPKFRKQFF